MSRRRIKKFHNKYPFVESIFLFLSGISIGFFSSLLIDEISSKSFAPNWNVLHSHNFWISIALIIVSIIYYWRFSSYALDKQLDSISKAEETLKLAIIKQAKKSIESEELTYENKLVLFNKTIKTIRNTDGSAKANKL